MRYLEGADRDRSRPYISAGFLEAQMKAFESCRGEGGRREEFLGAKGVEFRRKS